MTMSRLRRRRIMIGQLVVALSVAAGGIAVAGSASPAGSAWQAQTALPCSTLIGSINSVQSNAITATSCATAAPLQDVGFTVTGLPQMPTSWPGDPTQPVESTTTSTSGYLIWPLTAKVTGLVVYAHGCCNNPSTLEADGGGIAAATNSLVIALNYRAPTTANSRDSAGDWYAPDLAAEDLWSATQLVKTALPNIAPIVGFGISEGGAALALAIEHHNLLSSNPNKYLFTGLVDESGAVSRPPFSGQWFI